MATPTWFCWSSIFPPQPGAARNANQFIWSRINWWNFKSWFAVCPNKTILVASRSWRGFAFYNIFLKSLAGRTNPKDTTSVFTLESGSDEPVQVFRDDSLITITRHDQPVITYHILPSMPPAGKPSYYQRSGFIHPAFTPGGQIITDGFPEDHEHQHGWFYALYPYPFPGQYHWLLESAKRAGHRGVAFAGFSNQRTGEGGYLCHSGPYKHFQFGPILEEIPPSGIARHPV